MSNAIAQTVHAAQTAVVNEDAAPLATWTVGKNCTAKAAHTEAGFNAAPKKVRDAAALDATTKRVLSGRYVGFTRDAWQALSKGHREAFLAHLGRATAKAAQADMGGMVTALVAFDPERANKATFASLCEFLAAPRAVAKNVEAPKPLAKSQQWVTAVAVAWLAAQKPAKANEDAKAKPEAITA